MDGIEKSGPLGASVQEKRRNPEQDHYSHARSGAVVMSQAGQRNGLRKGSSDEGKGVAEVTSRLVFANVPGDSRSFIRVRGTPVLSHAPNDASEGPGSSRPSSSPPGSQRSDGASDQVLWSHHAEVRRQQEDKRLADAAAEVQLRLDVTRANIKTTVARIQV